LLRSRPKAGIIPTVSHTFRHNQSEAIVENVSRYIRKAKAKSLLDIGAGSPATAVPLSKAVNRYLAIEEDPRRADQLRRAGLSVICRRFPIDIGETFDLALSSHSVPEGDIQRYGDFLDSAWRSLNPGGTLLIITFKGSRGAVAELYEEMTGRPYAPDPDPQYVAILDNLNRRGFVRVERINSYLQSSDPDEIIDWISGSLFTCDAERSSYTSRVREILRMRYGLDGRYLFPEEHLLITIAKPLTSGSSEPDDRTSAGT
jgi:hypothetical protein